MPRFAEVPVLVVPVADQTDSGHHAGIPTLFVSDEAGAGGAHTPGEGSGMRRGAGIGSPTGVGSGPALAAACLVSQVRRSANGIG